jgi:hypothetical protein
MIPFRRKINTSKLKKIILVPKPLLIKSLWFKNNGNRSDHNSYAEAPLIYIVCVAFEVTIFRLESVHYFL